MGTKNDGMNRNHGPDERDKQMAGNSEKVAGLGATIAAKLMIGFWFGIGVMLAIAVVNTLNHCVGALTSSE